MPRNSDIAIVGVDESDEIGLLPGKPALQLHAEAAHNALADAGLSLRDVDGLFTAGPTTMEVAEYLGIRPRYMDGTLVGGSSFVVHLGHAALALQAGLCSVAVITHGESGRSRIGEQDWTVPPQLPQGQFENPFGLLTPQAYALSCSRHMHLFGTTSEQLAEIAVATRSWAKLNPKAKLRSPMTIADALDSPMVSFPLRRTDCCLVTDAGGAVVMTKLDRARDCQRRPVILLGHSSHHAHNMISQMPDLVSGPGVQTGATALGMAGITHDDIDVAQIYDSFTYTVLVSLEDLGFCKKGEGGAFVSGQRTAPGGSFPMNTSGGGLSYTHPGMFGVFLIIEAVRQLRHDYASQSIRQVPNAEIALVHGTGGRLSSASTAVLARG